LLVTHIIARPIVFGQCAPQREAKISTATSIAFKLDRVALPKKYVHHARSFLDIFGGLQEARLSPEVQLLMDLAFKEETTAREARAGWGFIRPFPQCAMQPNLTKGGRFYSCKLQILNGIKILAI